MEKELEFLRKLSNEELEPIVYIMKDDITSELSDEAENNPKDNLDEIINELEKYAGNTIANIFRGDVGISYREALEDVCRKQDVEFDEDISTEMLGEALIYKTISNIFDRMSKKEKKEFLEELKNEIGEKKFEAFMDGIGGMKGFFALSGDIILKLLSKHFGIRLYYWAVRLVVFFFHEILKKTAPKILVFGLPHVMKRTFGALFGPIAWVLLTAWTIFDIASPAYRVTIPVVTYIETIRIIKKDKNL